MGSLPNLNELALVKEKRRAREKERDLARERARQQDFSRDNGNNQNDGGAAAAKECLPMLFQVSNAQA